MFSKRGVTAMDCGAVGGLIAPAVGVADDAVYRVALRKRWQPVPGAVVAGGQPRQLVDVAAGQGQIFDLFDVDGRVDRVGRALHQRRARPTPRRLLPWRRPSTWPSHPWCERTAPARRSSASRSLAGTRSACAAPKLRFTKVWLPASWVTAGAGVIRGDVRQGQSRPGNRRAAGIHDGDADGTQRLLCPRCGDEAQTE